MSLFDELKQHVGDGADVFTTAGEPYNVPFPGGSDREVEEGRLKAALDVFLLSRTSLTVDSGSSFLVMASMMSGPPSLNWIAGCKWKMGNEEIDLDEP